METTSNEELSFKEFICKSPSFWNKIDQDPSYWHRFIRTNSLGNALSYEVITSDIPKGSEVEYHLSELLRKDMMYPKGKPLHKLDERVKKNLKDLEKERDELFSFQYGDEVEVSYEHDFNDEDTYEGKYLSYLEEEKVHLVEMDATQKYRQVNPHASIAPNISINRWKNIRYKSRIPLSCFFDFEKAEDTPEDFEGFIEHTGNLGCNVTRYSPEPFRVELHYREPKDGKYTIKLRTGDLFNIPNIVEITNGSYYDIWVKIEEPKKCEHEWDRPIINANNKKCTKCGIWEEHLTSPKPMEFQELKANMNMSQHPTVNILLNEHNRLVEKFNLLLEELDKRI